MRFPLRASLGPFVVLLLSGQPAQLAAQAGKHLDASIAFRLSTLGLGFEAGKLLGSHLSARVGANFGSFSGTKKVSDVAYDVKLKLHAVSALIDLYPRRRGSFHLTAGIVTSPFTVTGTGQASSGNTYDINHHTPPYTASQVGTLSGEGKLASVGPYFGLGFGTPARKRSALKFLFDLGAVIGKSRISLTSTGAATNQGLATDLQAERDKAQQSVDKYVKVYPVLSFGLAFRF